MKLFSSEVAIYATAYIKANSAKEARLKLKDGLVDAWLELPTGGPICGWSYERLLECEDKEMDVTLSPAVTVDHVLNDVEEVDL